MNGTVPSLTGAQGWVWVAGELLLGLGSLALSVFMAMLMWRLMSSMLGLLSSGGGMGNQPAWSLRRLWCRHRGGWVGGRTRTGRHTRFCRECGRDLLDSVQQELRR